MDESQLSYIITTNAPENINERFWTIKKEFDLYEHQIKIYRDSIITLNIAHITIKRRFYLKSGFTEGQLFQSLDSVVKKPFPIFASSLELFKSEKLGNVLTALVNKSQELQQLHENVFHAVLPYVESERRFEEGDFKPHLSVAYNIPDEKIEELTKAVQTLLPISYTLNNLFVLKNIPRIKKERAIAKLYTF